MPWLFAIIAYISRVLVSFGGLQLVDLKITDFGDLPFRWLLSVLESGFARLTKSRVIIASHLILLIFTRRERSWFNQLKSTELKTTWVESTSEGRPEFSLNIFWICEFPGGLVVRIPGFHCCGQGSVPGQGTEILQGSRCNQKFFKNFLKSIVIIMDRWVRFLRAILNFVPINSLC